MNCAHIAGVFGVGKGAVARKLAAVCLNVGGPGLFVTRHCGFPVANDLSYSRTVEELANGTGYVRARYTELSGAAIEAAPRWTSDKIVFTARGA